MDGISLIYGDCLEKMVSIEDKSVDMILCDPPYGTTQSRWDTIIPFDKMWGHYTRIVKDNGAMLLFGAEPFSSLLRVSNQKMYKYDWVWKKNNSTGFLNARKQPLRDSENISVFYRKQCLYNPQMKDKEIHKIRPESGNERRQTAIYGKFCVGNVDTRIIPIDKAMPTTTLFFTKINTWNKENYHTNQKPTDLLEYFIRTYTHEGDLVLDNCMGSGSTGVACQNTNRRFIGIEKDKNYFEIAKQRIGKNEHERKCG